MMCKLLSLLAAAGLALALAGPAASAVLDPTETILTLKLSGLNSIDVLAETDANVSLVGRRGIYHDGGTVWAATNYGPEGGTSLYTGVPLISNLLITVNMNALGAITGGQPTAQFSPPGTPNPVGPGDIGKGPMGFLPLNGVAKVFFGGVSLPANLAVVGAGGTETIQIGTLGQITLTGGPWVTGKIVMTGITTNIISIPTWPGTATGNAFTLDPPNSIEIKTKTTAGGFITTNPNGIIKVQHQVTLAGSYDITMNPNTTHTARITFVAPMRVNTVGLNIGNIPGQVKLAYKFVPEPGFFWLAFAGAAGLAVLGRRNVKK